jgi:foldase protein PrsA
VKSKEKSKPRKKAAKSKGGSVSEGTKAAGTMPVKPAVEPQHVQVQHILIGFAGSIPGKGITRTKEEAKKLAYEILSRAQKGEDYDALVRQYTDDSPPGIYGMSGNGVAPAAGEYPRSGMVPAFGNVGFAISPGNIGIADYDPQTSPYGWHIIKRLK